MAVSVFEEVELLEAAVQVGADVIPGVAAVGPVDIGVCPGVGEISAACQSLALAYRGWKWEK